MKARSEEEAKACGTMQREGQRSKEIGFLSLRVPTIFHENRWKVHGGSPFL
jgi:dihydrodipicolinate reductase